MISSRHVQQGPGKMTPARPSVAMPWSDGHHEAVQQTIMINVTIDVTCCRAPRVDGQAAAALAKHVISFSKCFQQLFGCET